MQNLVDLVVVVLVQQMVKIILMDGGLENLVDNLLQLYMELQLGMEIWVVQDIAGAIQAGQDQVDLSLMMLVKVPVAVVLVVSGLLVVNLEDRIQRGRGRNLYQLQRWVMVE